MLDTPGDSADLPRLVEVADRVGSLRVVDLDEPASSQDQETWDLPGLPVPDSVEPELPVLREAQRQRGFGLPELRVTEPEEFVSSKAPQEEVIEEQETPTPEPATLSLQAPPEVPPPLLANAPSLIERVPRSQMPQKDDADLLPGPSVEPLDEQGPSPAPPDPWEEPSALYAELDRLGGTDRAAPWAEAVRREVDALGRLAVEGSEDVRPALKRIELLASRAKPLAAELDDATAARVRVAWHALARRLELWKALAELGWPGRAALKPPAPDSRQLSSALAEVAALTNGSPHGRKWSRYLMVDALRQLPTEDCDADCRRRKIAREVLFRVLQTPLTQSQRHFLGNEALTSLGSELRRWADRPVDFQAVLREVEQYEKTGLPSDARRLAATCQALGISMMAGPRRLSDLLEARYREANFRVTVTETLLNRLMPVREPEYEWVSDTVLGNPVQGQSRSQTEVAMRMVPDPNRVRLALEVTGLVSALTSSTSGPATFFNNSRSTYVARKPIEVGVWGLHLSPAEVDVNNVTRLRALRTDFDAIPLIGLIVKNAARSQHDQKRFAVRREVERKIAGRAKHRVDTEADARLSEVSERIQKRILEPLERLSLQPKMTDAETTEERFTMRLRLAADEQLGGHAPRPYAPSDSLASFQIHQTAFNNLVEQLDLNGATYTLAGLRRHIATRLGRPEMLENESRHDNVEITFAPRDAVGIRCEQGRVVVTLSIARLVKSPSSWRNFQVRAFYRPEIQGLSAELVRDGVVRLIGTRLSTKSQFALRGIFSKVFSKDEGQPIVPVKMAKDPRLEGLAITQCALEHGWVSVALGPVRNGATHMARR